MAERKKQRNFFYRGTYFDYPTLFLVLFLAMFGVIMVMSISGYQGRLDADDSMYYFKRQLLFMVLGSVAMWFVSMIRYQFLKRWAFPIVIVCLILVIMVFFIGTESRGSSRWINLGFISFQPSEIAKLGIIIYVAYICSAKTRGMRSLLQTGLYMAPPIILALLVAKGNLSTGATIAVIAMVIWIVSTPRLRYLLVVIPLVVVGVMLFMGDSDAEYRGDRWEAFLNPWTSTAGYQTRQGLYAIGSGGLFGRGLGQSIMKQGGAVPEAHNDMIFSVICEELGIVGGIAIVVVFFMLIWRFRFIAEGAPDRFGALLMVGITTHIAFHVILNIFVVTRLAPNTGITLPFISYGGSSLFFLMVEMGIALSVSRQIVPGSLQEEVAG